MALATWHPTLCTISCPTSSRLAATRTRPFTAAQQRAFQSIDQSSSPLVLGLAELSRSRSNGANPLARCHRMSMNVKFSAALVVLALLGLAQGRRRDHPRPCHPSSPYDAAAARVSITSLTRF
jgi:hypothetical protein